ncbi:MAG: AlpA family phage regulatory protein [Desulfobulbaceae bacterium]|nr:AlpA family phage regulatory protein [Desulfobulbaceae bacterium]
MDESIGFMRLAEVLRVIPVGKTTWWGGVKTGRFPRPVKLSPGCSAWRRADIIALAERLATDQRP